MEWGLAEINTVVANMKDMVRRPCYKSAQLCKTVEHIAPTLSPAMLADCKVLLESTPIANLDVIRYHLP